MIYTLAVIKEEIKINLEKTAVKYGIEKLKEGIEYGGKILKAFEKWCEEGVENLIDKAKDIWDYVGLKLSDMLKDEETKESCYISVGCCLISGISIIEKALCVITYVTVNNVVRITKDKFIKALNKLIDNMCIDNKALNFILSINGLEKIKGAVKFIKLVELVGIKIDQYINEISLYTCGKKASEMSVRNITVCNGNGQIGIEYNLVPEINKVIDNVVNNLNKSISESLNQIENKMNGLKYTSFFLDTNYCRQSLSNQRTSLHDFKNELSHYEARMETMEDRIIGKLNSIECDC